MCSCLCASGSDMFSLCLCFYNCMSAHTCACKNAYHSICLCLHVFCVRMTLWICAMTVTVGSSVEERLCIVPVRGCCGQSALAGQCQQVQHWVAVGEGLQHPALGDDFWARKSVVPLVLLHLLLLFRLRRLPQYRLSLITYPNPPPRAKSASSSPS